VFCMTGFTWGDLPSDIQAAAATLGYTEEYVPLQ
jgi:hypothetical protein